MVDENSKELAKPVDIITAETPKQNPTRPRSRLPGILWVLLVLALFSATGWGGYYLWQQQLMILDLQQSRVSELNTQIQQLEQADSTLNDSIDSSNASIESLQNQQDRITEVAQQAIDITNRQQKGWMLAEIDYLLRMANRRLQIARDINSAIAALKAADDRLHELADLSMFDIRQQLNKDIANLKALYQVDVNGTAMALDQMLVHLSELPYKSVIEEVKTQLNESEAITQVSDEESGFMDTVLNTMMKIGDIKIHDRSIEPASSREQQQFIEQMLRTHLLGARIAVLRYDQTQYLHDLEQAQNLLHGHYKSSDNRVNQMKSDLASYASINLTPDLPNITKSWTMLQQHMLDQEAARRLQEGKP